MNYCPLPHPASLGQIKQNIQVAKFSLGLRQKVDVFLEVKEKKVGVGDLRRESYKKNYQISDHSTSGEDGRSYPTSLTTK